MVTLAPPKARSDIEILLERFNEWTESRIGDYVSMPELSESSTIKIKARIDTLKLSKVNLEILTQRIIKDDIEILLKEFSNWVYKMIDAWENLPFLSASHAVEIKERINTLKWAKTNLEILAKKVINGNTD